MTSQVMPRLRPRPRCVEARPRTSLRKKAIFSGEHTCSKGGLQERDKKKKLSLLLSSSSSSRILTSGSVGRQTSMEVVGPRHAELSLPVRDLVEEGGDDGDDVVRGGVGDVPVARPLPYPGHGPQELEVVEERVAGL